MTARPIDIVKRVLREQGLDDHGAHPHGWWCERPDRFPGYCTCVNDMAEAIVDALAPSMTEPEQTGENR
jgi:hypothetical protein